MSYYTMDMNRCVTSGRRHIAMPSQSLPHVVAPSFVPFMATGAPTLPCFMQGCYNHLFPWQSLAFPPISYLPASPKFENQCISERAAPPAQPKSHTNKSFYIKDILASDESTSQTFAKSSGRAYG